MNPRFIFITTAIVLAAISRLLPHFPNFTPIAAMALFGGVCYSNRWLAISLPLVAMVVSDAFIGFHNTLVYVYASFVVTSLLGMYISSRPRPLFILGGSLVSSVIFFLVTNFGVYMSGGAMEGVTSLSATYVVALPFFGATLLGDLFYNAILFGAFHLASLRFPQLSKA